MSYHSRPVHDFTIEYDLNPYESFMRNHLKHYGYYTGRNENYRTPNKALKAWDQANGYDLSDGGSDTEYENQAIKDGDKTDLDRAADGQRTTQVVFSYSAGKMVPKLREPRNLYALSKDSGPQQAPRWPADIEVLPQRVEHIDYIPKEAEPFYQPSGFEKTPMPLPEGEGRVVYHHPLTQEEYFLRSRIGGNRNGPIPRAVKLKSAEDSTLIFESRFESGNLMKAIQVSEHEYELELRYDLYTRKHTQWFYFRFSNVRRNVRYRFTITNFMKSGSLYNSGMRPLMYSEQDAQTRGIGWRRVGEDIKYYKNDVRRKDMKGERCFYYSLTWTFTVPYDNDVCYFAHCYPYTYSDLQDYLQNVSNDPIRSRYCKQRILCRSLAGNMVYLLTITSPSINPDDAKAKKAVVVTARVHPGETNSSWMMKGFLDYLTSEMPDAKLLRDMFVFKIVPMLNPDGVIVGNYRCSLAGRDLNRNYKTILKDSFPSVTHTKAMVKKVLEEREVVVYCDLHGHSRKQNVFIYGCDNKKNPDLRLKERVFPIILHNNAEEKFSFNNCKFKVQKSKEGTGRVVIWQMGILNSYTMEASFCGSTMGERKLHHFSTAEFEAMGYHFCDSLLDYCDPDEGKCNQILADLEEKLRREILAHLERTGTPLPNNGFIDLSADYSSAVESSTTGSDSSADDGLPVHLIALAPKLSKKKKLKTRKERDKKRLNAEKGKEKEKEKEKTGITDSPQSAAPEPIKEAEPEKKAPSAKEKKENKEKLRYRHGDRSSLHSAGRGRQTPCRPDGGPPFVQERSETKNLKKTEYLEALTNAYLMSGILKPAAEESTALRYSQGSHGLAATGLPLGQVEGLCPHHEKAFAEQFVANQLAGLSFADDKYNWSHTAIDTRRSMESATYHSAPARDRRSADQSQLITTTAPHGQPGRPKSGYATPSRLSRRELASPTKTIVSPADGVAEARGDIRRQRTHSDHVKRGVSSEALILRNGNCSTSTNYAVQDTNRSLEPARQPMKVPGRHSDLSSSSPDGAPSGAIPRSRTATTPANYQELISRRGARSEVATSQGIPLHLSIVTGTTNASPMTLGQGAGQSQGSIIEQGEGQSSDGTCQPLATIQKAEPCLVAGQTLANQKTGSSSSETPFTSSTLNWPKGAPQAKNHSCTTEATPISDPAMYIKQNLTPSSHHFKKAQDFYGSAVSCVSPTSQPEQHPSPTSLGSAARLQAKYGRKVQSAVAAPQMGESPRSYRGTLRPVSRQVAINQNNSNNSACTSPEDVESQELPSTSDDGFIPAKTTNTGQHKAEQEYSSDPTDCGPGAVGKSQTSDDRNKANLGKETIGQANAMANPKTGVDSPKGNPPSKRPDVKAEFKRLTPDLDSRDSASPALALSSNNNASTSGDRRTAPVDIHGSNFLTPVRSPGHTQDLKHQYDSQVPPPSHSPSSPSHSGNARHQLNPLQYSAPPAASSTTDISQRMHPANPLHASHPLPSTNHVPEALYHHQQASPTSRSRMDSTSPLQKSPRLLDRSTIHRSVDGSLQVRKPIPKERARSGYASAQDLHELGSPTNGDQNEVDMFISMTDNPYKVTLEPGSEPGNEDTSLVPAGVGMTPMTAVPSPRARGVDKKPATARPLSSKRRGETSPRQHPRQGDPPAGVEADDDPQYFQVSKLALQNRSLERTLQGTTPRSPTDGPGPLLARGGSAAVGDHMFGGAPGRPAAVPRPKTHSVMKLSHKSAKGQKSPQLMESAKQYYLAEGGDDRPKVVIHQGGFTGHRTQPAFLRVQYNRKK